MGPLSSECAPQPATVLPQPPPTFCLPAVRGFLGVLSSVTSGRVCNPPTPPLRNSFGVLHSSPYLSTPFSDYLCFIWEDEGLGKSGIHLCIPAPWSLHNCNQFFGFPPSSSSSFSWSFSQQGIQSLHCPDPQQWQDSGLPPLPCQMWGDFASDLNSSNLWRLRLPRLPPSSAYPFCS